ncbi:MAG: methyl-accepting chemotaxis protein [Spirochaetaceae bacterium]|jgi:methyl-accepting chemotaxis protein|nr:methyl-accepting chemotaxis protein [Spirochaetaceae bacterium]
MKIGVKLVTTITAFNLLAITLLVAFILFLSQKEITRLVDEQAQSIASQSSEHIGEWLGGYMDIARTVSQIMQGYASIPSDNRRDYFNLMLRQVLIAQAEPISIWTNWGPNMLDGMDEQFVDTSGTDATGRFISSWVSSPNGPLLEAVRFDWNMIANMPELHQEYIFNPSISPSARKNLSTAMSIPVRDGSTMVGCVGISLDLSRIQNMVQSIKPFGDGSAMVFSSGGLVAAHTDPSRLGQNMRESEADTFGPFLDTMVEAVSTGTTASFSFQPSKSDTVIQYYSVPFTIGQIPKPWTLVVGVSHNTIMAPVYRMLNISLIIGVLSIIVMSIGVFFMARSISRPINTLARMLKDISEGEGDLTKTITITEHNEIGDLAHYFNLTISKIKNLVIAIRKESQALSLTGSDLASNMTETAASINEITANIQSIKSQTSKQSASVKDTNGIMRQVVDHIDLINKQIQKQTDCVGQSSSAVEQILANIQSVTQSLARNEINVTKLVQASEVGRNGLQEVSGDIKEIAQESEGLLEINAVMENIASQTNLLSMNAAIEAAHAGEAGKGFAVVAEEIRKLAESSAEQSKTISDVLLKIKESIEKITTATNEVLMNFEAVSEGVKMVTDQEREVRNAMEEQGMGSKAILESMSSLNEITGEVKKSAQGMIGGSREVIKESEMLEQIAAKVGEGMQEMACGAEQIDAAVHKVNDISIENKRQIELLMTEVLRFKVE